MSSVQETMSPIQEEPNTHDLHQGYVELYHHGLVHVKSTALRCAVGLGIPSAIHRCGGAATLPHIITETGINPAKLSYLRRLMRVLTFSGVFNADHPPDEGETLYTLTNVSRILVNDDKASTSCDLSALLSFLARPSTSVSTYFSMEEWFRDAGTTTLFETAHGVPPWTLTKNDASYNKALSDAWFADSTFSMDILLKDAKSANILFCGLSSLVDVGGGHGAAAMAIAKAFPHIKCSVLELEQMISKAPLDGAVKFIAGDMFEFIPPAAVVFLKDVLNCWDDNHCVQILRQCKRAIPTRDAGGKVIIMNIVVGYGAHDNVVKETHVLYDMYMMRYIGAEREEHEWKKVIIEAGFSC